MTKQALKAYIKKDILRLQKEQYKLKEKPSKPSHELLVYVISRKHTLNEMLELLENKERKPSRKTNDCLPQTISEK